MTTRDFVVVDANWSSTTELFSALSGHLPGVLIEAREWRQAWRAGWFGTGQMRLKQLRPGLWCRRYALPAGWFHTFNRVSMPLLGSSIARQTRRAIGSCAQVWIFTSPYYLRMLETVRVPFAVYHPVDDYRWYWPRLAARTARLETEMVSRAGLVVCVSRHNLERLRKTCPDNPDKVVHVPNGAPERFYRRPDPELSGRWHERLAAFPRPLFAYTGDPVKRVDFGMVEALAAATRGSILFAGPTRLPEPLNQHQNIRAIGPMLADEVPTFLRAVDVLLIPQEDSEFNRATSPKKLWEYCASGKPIVGACLTEVDPSSDGIRVASSVTEFVRHAQDLAAGGDTAVDRDARRKVAEAHAYPALARRLLAHLVERWPALASDHTVRCPGGTALPSDQAGTASRRKAGGSP